MEQLLQSKPRRQRALRSTSLASTAALSLLCSCLLAASQLGAFTAPSTSPPPRTQLRQRSPALHHLPGNAQGGVQNSGGAHAGAAPAFACAAVGLAAGLAAMRSPRQDAHRTPCAGKKKGKGGGGGGGGGGAEEEALDIDTEAIIKEYEEKMTKTVDMLQQNLVTIRAGKATPALVEGVQVSAYESMMKLPELATVTASDTTTLMVNVFDEAVAPAVAKAIMTADLGFTVQEAGTAIKVSIPPITKDKRLQFVKLAKDYTEKAKVAIRNIRQTAMKKIKSYNKKLPEDTVKGMEKDVESLVKTNVSSLDAMFKKKEDELTTI